MSEKVYESPTTNTMINLKEAYPAHRVTLEDGAGWRDGDVIDRMEIRGKYGIVYPFSNTLLAVDCDSARQTAKLEYLGLTPFRGGGDCATFLFEPERFDEVDAIIHLRRRRRVNLSEEQRREIGERLRQGRETIAGSLENDDFAHSDSENDSRVV